MEHMEKRKRKNKSAFNLVDTAECWLRLAGDEVGTNAERIDAVWLVRELRK